MNLKKISSRIMALVIGSAMLLQSGFVVPVFAADTFWYNFWYNESNYMTENIEVDDGAGGTTVEIKDNPIIIPQEDIDANGGEASLHNGLLFSDDDGVFIGTVGETLPKWGPEPYRIIGYTFDGWFIHMYPSYDPSDTRQGRQITKDTPVESDMLHRDTGEMDIYSYWSKYKSPYLAEGSMSISAKNSKKEKLGDVTIKDTTENKENIQNGKYEYTGEVYGNYNYLTMEFEVYEPDFESVTMTLNGEEVALDPAKRRNVLTQNAYVKVDDGGDGRLENKANTVKGVVLGTVDDAIELQSGDNVIEITVTLPEVVTDDPRYSPGQQETQTRYQESKTYTITIKRLPVQIVPMSGNSPYGEILRRSDPNLGGLSEEQMQVLRNKFDSEYKFTYSNKERYYSPKAWDLQLANGGEAGTEVVKGSIPSGSEYINYDKDDTAIFVYADNTFTDPGITVYDSNGDELELDNTHNVKRVILNSAGDTIVPESVLNGTADENNITLPQNIEVGIYTIKYTYESSEGDVVMTKNMIVLPNPGDVNMDGYVNSLDVNEYASVSSAYADLPESIYAFRAMDLNYDTLIDAQDASIVKARASSMPFYYRDLSIYSEQSKSAYTPSNDGTRAQMTMEYLGKGDAPQASKVTQSAGEDAAEEAKALEAGDTFWLGFKITDIDKAEEFAKGINSMTFSLDYDQRYIEPAASGDEWISAIKNNNAGLSDFSFDGITKSAAVYSYDNSTADYEWTDIKQVRTAIFDMYKGSNLHTVSEGGYLIKIPFKVKLVPPKKRDNLGQATDEYVNIISAKLGANTMNISFGADGGEYREMWDTSDSLNNSTANMMSCIDYTEDCPILFGKEADVIDLNTRNDRTYTYTYGTHFIITYSKFEKGVLYGTLPKGMEYNSSVNRIAGTPEEVGTFEFYIDAQPYSITIDKKDLVITAEDKTKTYGDTNPEFTYTNSGIVTGLGDTFDAVLPTKPTLTCDSSATQVGETAEIVISGGTFGSSGGKNFEDYYNLVLTNGTLTVNKKREINITGISDIPSLTPTDITQARENGQTSVTFENQSASYRSGEFTAEPAEGSGDAVVNNDSLKITYDVTYNDLTSPTVTISNLVLSNDEGFERGVNYTVKSYPTEQTGQIQDKTVTRLRAARRGNNLKTSYTYGETLDLTGVNLTIQYDDGGSTDVSYSNFASNDSGYEIVAKYVSAGEYTDMEAHNGDRLDVKNFDDFYIRFELKGKSSVNLTSNTIKLAKKDLRLKILDTEKTYGEDNSVLNDKYNYEIVTSDLVSWDSAKTKDTLDGFVAPAIQCSSTIDETTEIGTYDDVITASGSVSDNYTISYVNNNLESKGASLTINQRELSITSIDPSTVPDLEFDDYDGKTAPFYADGSAYYNDDEDKTITSMSGHVNGDKIKINYKTQYANSTATHADSKVNVNITNLELDTTDDEYSRGKNYQLASSNSVTDSTYYQYKGKVHRGVFIKSIAFDPAQTLKTSYIYGERLDFTTKNIIISYDNDTTENVSIADILANFTVDLKVEYNEESTQRIPTADDKLIVGDVRNKIRIFHNSEEYLPFEEFEGIEIPLTITKKTVHIAADRKTMIYGNNPPEYTYTFTESDFDDDFGGNEYKSTKAEREELLAGWEDPAIAAKENDRTTDVSSATKLGTYDLILSGGQADNYEFSFTNSTITINQRPLYITDITKVPVLTAENIYKNQLTFSDITDTLNAENGTLTSTGVVNNDTVKITYTLRYNDAEPGGNKRVTVVSYSIGSDADEYNYYINSFVQSVNIGVAKEEHLLSAEITAEPERDDYIYGETLDLSQYAALLTYDSTRVERDISFENLPSYGVNITYTKLKNDGNAVTAASGDLMAPSVNETDDTLTLTYDSWDIETETSSEQTTETTAKINVSKKLMHVIVNDAPNVIYGVNPSLSYTFEYNSDDFADVDKEQGARSEGFRLGLVAPTLSAYDGENEIRTGKDIGTYTNAIRITNKDYAGTSNYRFDMEDKGTLTINKRALEITSINNVPELTREQVINNNYELINKIDWTAWGSSDYDDELSFAEGDTETGIFSADQIGIKYRAVYNSISANDNAEVDIEYDDDWLDTVHYPKGSNYTITKPDKSYGSISSSIVSSIEIVEEPRMKYNYGESFSLSGYVNMVYDSGEKLPCDFDKLSEYGAVVVFADKTGGEKGAELTEDEARVFDSRTLTINKHNGKCLKIYLEDRPDVSVESDSVLEITPHEMHIIIEPKSSVYGNAVANVSSSYHYNEEDLVNGDSLTSDNFTTGLKNPVIYCDEVTSTSPAGVYEGAIKGKDAESVNYTFTYVPADYTVEKRPVTVHAIKSGIPILVAQLISDEPGSTHKIKDAFAATDNSRHLAEIYNMLTKDKIGITYTAVYNSVEPATNVTVGIEDIVIDDSYGDSKNYYLSTTEPSVSSADGGVITYRKISEIIILQQPKLEYTYGETLDLESGRVRIQYDVGGYDEYSFIELPASELTLTYKDGTTVTNGDVLDVNYYNGNTMTIKVIGSSSVESKTTEPIIVNKKRLNIDAAPVTVTYGEPVTYSWSYRKSDFVNNDVITEDETSETFLEDLVEPTLSCLDNNNNTPDETSDAGTYDIIVSGGRANNYEFVYNNSTLTINKRPIDINSISNIPMLTAQFRTNNPGPPYRVPARAVSSLGQTDVSNLINDDEIAVSYTAVYINGTPASSVSVGLEDIELDDDYGQSSNYTLAYKAISSPNGSVNDSNITELRVIKAPQLEYEYGDHLDLDDSTLRIYYDDGTNTETSFADITKYGLSFKYTGTDTDVVNNTFLTIDEYNGLTFDIKVLESIYDVSDITTQPLQVSKRTLGYGTCPVQPITYDGKTTATTGQIVFTNTIDGEDVHGSGTFSFESSSAGTNKLVNVTDITLDEEWTHNYELASASTTTRGTINKTTPSVPEGDITTDVSDVTNTLTITVPPLTEDLRIGGAEYEYSIDGGETWSKSNVFLNQELDKICDICVRIAETDNYTVSEATEPFRIKTFKVKLTLISRDKPAEGQDYRILRSFFTNTDHFENETELRNHIGPIMETSENGNEREVQYYTLYQELENSARIKFPLDIVGYTTIYTTLKKPHGSKSDSSSGGGGGGDTDNTPKLEIELTDPNGTDGAVITEINSTPTSEDLMLKTKFNVSVKNQTVEWSSSDENVVKVDKNGVVSFIGEGDATITVVSTYNKSIKATIPVSVKKDEPEPTASPEPASTPEPTVSPEPADKKFNQPYMSGFEGLIKPDDNMTRAEAATIMVKLAGETDDEYPNVFPDVREDTWYIGYISQAYARGLIAGFEDGNFYPEDTITREQFTAMVVRLAGLESVEGSSFTDVKPERWSAGSIAAAVEKGIVEGYGDGTFMPENPVRRSEAARIANVATNRVYDRDYLDTIPCPFTDLPYNHWAYYEFISAAVEFEIP